MQLALPLATCWLACLALSLPTFAEASDSAIPLCHNATSLFTNANFITLDPKNPKTNALAVTKQRIVAVGDQQTLLANCRGKDTQVVDLKGAVVVPGFIDTHSQFLLYGWLANHALDLSTTNVFQRPDWKPTKTTEDFLSAVKTNKQEGDWLIVNGYDPTRIIGLALNQTMLDEISSDRAIVVFYSSGNQALVNSAAAKKIASQASAEKINITKDGFIQNEDLQHLLNLLINKEQATEAIQTAAKQYAEQGYTTVTEVQAHPDWLASYEQLTSQAAFPMDVVLNPTSIQEKQRIDVIYQDYPRLYPGPMVIQVDGVPNERQAYFTHPYLPEAVGQSADWRGKLNQTPRALENIFFAASQAKAPIALECNGDAAIDLALNLTSKVQLRYKDAAFHPMIFNADFARNDQLQRMHQLGLKVSWFAPQLYYWGEALCQEVLGPRLASRDNPLASAQKILGAINIQANSPSTPPNPLQMMRLVNSGEIQSWYYPATQKCPKHFRPKEEISLDNALAALTIEAAKLYSLEKDKGSLISGKLADMTLLSSNPLKANNLEDVKVLGTISRGVLHLNEGQVPKTANTTKN